jgi:hypothetical protein
LHPSSLLMGLNVLVVKLRLPKLALVSKAYRSEQS